MHDNERCLLDQLRKISVNNPIYDDDSCILNPHAEPFVSHAPFTHTVNLNKLDRISVLNTVPSVRDIATPVISDLYYLFLCLTVL